MTEPHDSERLHEDEAIEYAARHFTRPTGPRYLTPAEVLDRARRRAAGLPDEPTIPERLARAFRRFIVND